MCVIAVKYMENFGWVGAKNRDRNYKTEVEIIQSNKNNYQRLYIDDKLSRWSEGINEDGVSILSASFSVKSDEKEGDKLIVKRKNKRNTVGYYSPDGRAIRIALMESTPENALDILIERNLAGATFVFNQEKCYLLEGGFTVRKADASKDNPRKYIYKVTEISKEDGYECRTNHGIHLPQLGYMKDPSDERLKRSRKSSEMRYSYALSSIKSDIDTPNELIDLLAKSPDKDVFMNPIRIGDTNKNEMVTTGQLLLIPKERTMHYRPIFSSVKFSYNKLNGVKAKTFFEIVSSRKLLSFQEYFKAKINKLL